MSYAIFSTITNRILKDKDGYQHIYSTKEQAEQIAEKLRIEFGDNFAVKPV